ncbi:MAG TPA: ATP-binding protein, partial [Magnetococcales bacterium]|nr:ATP-binding protein [Magnetococcales bacterium]
MLLRFCVENLYCFAEEAVLSMIATKDPAHPSHLYQANKVNALRVAALYGANAHGKSRLVQAMQLAKTIITQGVKSGQSIPVKPFLLDKRFLDQPSRFEFTFTAQGIEYTYGFVCDNKRFHEEWLYFRPKQREIMLFERVVDAAGASEFNVSRTLARSHTKGRKFLDFLTESVRENQSFLTHSDDHNLGELKPVFNWFNHRLVCLLPSGSHLPAPFLAHVNNDFREFIETFMKTADTGICNFKSVRKNVDAFPQKLLEKMLEEIEKKGDDTVMFAESNNSERILIFSGREHPAQIELMAGHNTSDGDIVDFKMDDESTGTRRLLQLLPLLHYREDDAENVYVIDELDRTLHPSLSRLFLETFLNSNADSKNQLIFTTHESNLLDLDLL